MHAAFFSQTFTTHPPLTSVASLASVTDFQRRMGVPFKIVQPAFNDMTYNSDSLPCDLRTLAYKLSLEIALEIAS